MSPNRPTVSLPPGRNSTDLTDSEIRRATATFLGFDNKVNARYVKGVSTRFVVTVADNGDEFGEIIVSEDIYPGTNITNPNATLSLSGAAAHELAHYNRWANKSELEHGVLTADLLQKYPSEACRALHRFFWGSESRSDVEDASHDGDFIAIGGSWVSVSIGQDTEDLEAGDAVLDPDAEPAQGVVVGPLVLGQGPSL